MYKYIQLCGSKSLKSNKKMNPQEYFFSLKFFSSHLFPSVFLRTMLGQQSGYYTRYFQHLHLIEWPIYHYHVGSSTDTPRSALLKAFTERSSERAEGPEVEQRVRSRTGRGGVVSWENKDFLRINFCRPKNSAVGLYSCFNEVR